MVRTHHWQMRCVLVGLFIGCAIGAQTEVRADHDECVPAWLEGPQPDGVEHAGHEPATVFALAMFDDGSGDGPAQYVAGQFIKAGSVQVGGIARWDGHEWSSVGEYGFDSNVYALAVFDDGAGAALYAAGQIGKADAQHVGRIAKWDGTTWSALAPLEAGGVIYALQVFDDGSGPALYAGGLLPVIGGDSAGNIRKWDGTSWSEVGSGVNGTVRALTVFDDGTGPALYVGGQFTQAGGQPSLHIARWDGHAWSDVGGGFPGSHAQVVRSLAAFDDGSGMALYVGSEAHAEDEAFLTRWNGDWWETLAVGITPGGWPTRVTALAPARTEEGEILLVGGYFLHPPPSTNVTAIGVWDGTSLKLPTWGAPEGWGTGIHAIMVRPRVDGPDAVTIAGSFRFLWTGGPYSNSLSVRNIAEFDGTRWRIFERGFRILVRAMSYFDDGAGSELHAFGSFVIADGTFMNSIARWNGHVWEPAMGGVTLDQSGGAGLVFAVTPLEGDDGESLVVAGRFTQAGDIAARNIALRRNGRWQTMGDGLNQTVQAVALFPGGEDAAPVLIAGGQFQSSGETSLQHIAQWDGAQWLPLGSGLNGTVVALEVFDDGAGPALFAGGYFTMAGDVPVSHLARWDGAQWSAVGGGTDGEVEAFHIFDDGSGAALYVGGDFIHAGNVVVNRIAKWDGRTWSALGDGVETDTLNVSVRAIGSFNDGSGAALYSGSVSPLSDGTQLRTVGRWDGRSWTTYEDDLVGIPYVFFELPESDASGPGLFAGGFFLGLPFQPHVGARILRGCPVEDVVCLADLNGDHRVDYRDLTQLLAAWGPCNGCAADINGDGAVNGDDLTILIGEWGLCAD